MCIYLCVHTHAHASVHVFVSIFVCRYTCKCVCACRGQRAISGMSSQELFILFSETRSLSGLELTKWVGWLAIELQCPPVSVLPALEFQVCTTMLDFFYVVPKISNSCLRLAPAISQLSHLPCPHPQLLKSYRKGRSPISCKNMDEGGESSK